MPTIQCENFLTAISDSQRIAFEGGIDVFWSDIKPKVKAQVSLLQKQPDSHWVLYEETPSEFLIGFLSLLLAQKTIILPANNQAETVKILEASLGDKAQVFKPEIVSLDSTSDDSELILRKDAQIILFTSGSSGQAKAVIKTLENLVCEIEMLEELWGRDVHRFFSTVSHQHLYGLLFRLLWPFFSSKAFSNKQIKYPEELTKIADNDVLVTSPAILSRLDKHLSYGKVGLVFSSGGPLEKEDSDITEKLLRNRPIEVYGSTESGGIAYRSQTTDKALWQLFPRVKIKELEDGFVIHSPFIVEDELLLDDRLELVDGHQFKLLGRKDRVVKVEEKRVSLEQLEAYVGKSQFVEEAKCLLLDDKRNSLAIVVSLTDHGQKYLEQVGKRVLVSALKSQLLKVFELVVLPKKWRFVDQMPRNAMNKINLEDLRRLFI